MFQLNSGIDKQDLLLWLIKKKKSARCCGRNRIILQLLENDQLCTSLCFWTGNITPLCRFLLYIWNLERYLRQILIGFNAILFGFLSSFAMLRVVVTSRHSLCPKFSKRLPNFHYGEQKKQLFQGLRAAWTSVLFRVEDFGFLFSHCEDRACASFDMPKETPALQIWGMRCASPLSFRTK